MTAPHNQCQPMTAHTPTPWKLESDGEQIWSADGYGHELIPLAKMEGWRHWLGDKNLSVADRKANAAFIVEAVNNYASLRSQVSELRDALREIDAIISDWERIMSLPGAKEVKTIWNIAIKALAMNSQHSDGEAK